jgi:hypothetical protein
MNRVLKKIEPIQLGKVLTVLYGLISLIFVPIFLIIAVVSPQGFGPGAIMAILFPLLYAIGGFIFGVIGAFVYNIVAGWVGGIQIQVEDI